jgi:hypothetical protein
MVTAHHYIHAVTSVGIRSSNTPRLKRKGFVALVPNAQDILIGALQGL